MYKIKTLNKISTPGLDLLESFGCTTGDDIEKPDALLVRSAKLHDMQFDPETVCISRAGAGVNNIPIERCTEEGIVVFNTPGANAEAVKELAICALLLASRDVIGGVEWVRGLNEDGVAAKVEKGKSAFVGPELMGKTLGVIGLGAVGAKIANVALSLGMTVYGYDPYLSVDAAWMLSSNVIPAQDLDTIYRSCDYLTLHVPYLDSTHHMLNADAFAKMKQGVRIINLARAELVNDNAMLEALENGSVSRYVTDFPNDMTAHAPGVVPLPHLGASTPESEEKCALMAARDLNDYLKNGNINHSVNLPNVSLERMGVARLCVIHRNVPRMINGFLDLIGEQNINVEHMINKPRGEYAYTIIDTGTKLDREIIDKISQMKEVLRVRVI
ncbi:MAG: phosphoglycerate dehydrogenase [Oscillospiraceae bacterium]|nr:phosphoglycerate dehydrogenase [Oscillospiraceae bacterium]